MGRRRGKYVDYDHLSAKSNVYFVKVNAQYYFDGDNTVIRENCRNGNWSYKFIPYVPEIKPSYWNDYQWSKAIPASLTYVFENEQDAIFFKMAMN